MRTRTIRMIGVLFGLSLMLTACDAEDVLALLDGGVAAQDATADAAGDVADDDVAQDAGDDDAADEDGEVDGKSEGREFQCRKEGVRRAKEAAADDAGDASARDAAADGGDDAPAAKDDTDAAPSSKDAPARKKAAEPEEPAPSGGNGGAAANLSSVEQQIFDRLNATRREAGLTALTLSAEISRGAKQWSCDMAASGNFRHADLRAAGVNGENIAWGQRSAAEVHEGWMNSPGHRDNRMSSRWTEYGVGVCEDGGGRLYFTERFR